MFNSMNKNNIFTHRASTHNIHKLRGSRIVRDSGRAKKPTPCDLSLGPACECETNRLDHSKYENRHNYQLSKTNVISFYRVQHIGAIHQNHKKSIQPLS